VPKLGCITAGVARFEIDKIDTRIWELFRVPQPAKIVAVVAEIEEVHIRFFWRLDLNPICKFSRLTGIKLELNFLAFCD
jgi:hypothetical protein